jgi:CBS domain-containing protein
MKLSKLASTVETIRPDATLEEAARIMTRDSIGALLISSDARGPLEGIVTDRDIVKKIASGVDPSRATVAEFTGLPVTTAPEHSSRHEITNKMRAHGIRRLPLVDATGRVTAIVSLDDLLVELGEELFDLARAIHAGFQHESPDFDRDQRPPTPNEEES